MPHDVTMPQLGMAQDAGRIVAWLKAEGNTVKKGDALFEVETDKATMEVEAQGDGFLSGVSAAEGDDVPVGQVIARITDSPEAAAPEPRDNAAEPASAGSGRPDLPEGASVTMPQLGMAQDSGIIVGWLKAPGDAVAADDALVEVETDKSTMEVPAGRDGFLAATLAEPGEEVPVGGAVAVISAGKPATPVARSIEAAAGAPPPGTTETKVQETPAAERPATTPRDPQKSAQPAPGGRILASPKARRLALEQGLDLSRLAAAGHPQPFHVRDLDTLRALPAAKPETAPAAPALRLTAETAEDGVPALAAWAAKTHDLGDPDALLAGLAGASLPGGGPGVVTVERVGAGRQFEVPKGRALSRVTASDGASDAAPDLILRDLRGTRVRDVTLGAAAAPVLTLASDGAGLSITLECAPTQLDPDGALAVLTLFAGRVEQPLRHLL